MNGGFLSKRAVLWPCVRPCMCAGRFVVWLGVLRLVCDFHVTVFFPALVFLVAVSCCPVGRGTVWSSGLGRLTLTWPHPTRYRHRRARDRRRCTISMLYLKFIPHKESLNTQKPRRIACGT